MANPTPVYTASELVVAQATSLYERTGDIKDINTYVIPLATLKFLKQALEDV